MLNEKEQKSQTNVTTLHMNASGGLAGVIPNLLFLFPTDQEYNLPRRQGRCRCVEEG